MVLAHLLFATTQADIFDSPEAWFAGGGWFRKTVSGESVNPAKSMTLSVYYACIRNISEDIAKLPFIIYERSEGKRGKTRALTHHLYDILQQEPNPETTSNRLRELMTGWALAWGNAFAEIERDGTGRPVRLWPIHPSRCNLHRVDGLLVLDVSASDMGMSAVSLPYSDVFHLANFSDDGISGLSVGQLAAESVGLGLAAQSYGAQFFGNGATPSLVLSHPGKLGAVEQANLRESWKKRHGGKNSAGVAVLQEGIKIDRISVPPEEAQFLQSRQFQISEIARWFRMPPHMVQDLSRSTNNNIEHQSIEYVTNTLMPWANRWEKEAEKKLLDPRERKQYDINHLFQALLKGDSKTRSEFYRTMVNLGAMTPNEVREAEDMNPIPGDAADKLYMQSGMATLDAIASGQFSKQAPAEEVKKEEEEEPKPPEEAPESSIDFVYGESGDLIGLKGRF